MGPRAGLDGCGKSRPQLDSIPGPSSRYTNCAITVYKTSEIPAKYLNVMLERVEKINWSDGVRNEEMLHRVKVRSILRTAEITKANRIGHSGFGGLEVACWPLGSDPAEAVGFFRAKKSSARLPSERK